VPTRGARSKKRVGTRLRRLVSPPYGSSPCALASVNMSAPARQMPPKLATYRFEQPGRNEAVMETIASTRDVGEVKGPIVLAGVARIDVGFLRGQTKVVCHACRDQLRAFAVARFVMRYWQISDPERLSTGQILDFQKVDDQTWPIFSAVWRRRVTRPTPNKSIMNDKSQLGPGKRHQSSMSAFKPRCRSSILLVAMRLIFSTGISSIRYTSFRF
jgi:hypothetical protein